MKLRADRRRKGRKERNNPIESWWHPADLAGSRSGVRSDLAYFQGMLPWDDTEKEEVSLTWTLVWIEGESCCNLRDRQWKGIWND